MPLFRDIRQFTQAHYSVHVSWDYLETWLKDHEDMNVQLDPEFQRGHVWTEEQQIAYVEYRLRGGLAANELFWNCAGWMKLGTTKGAFRGPMYLVDGLQRLTAVRRFVANEIPAFEHRLSEYKDEPDRIRNAVFIMSVNNLDDYSAVLQWYLDLNTGGVVHSTKEIARVRKLLDQEKKTCVT